MGEQTTQPLGYSLVAHVKNIDLLLILGINRSSLWFLYSAMSLSTLAHDISFLSFKIIHSSPDIFFQPWYFILNIEFLGKKFVFEMVFRLVSLFFCNNLCNSFEFLNGGISTSFPLVSWLFDKFFILAHAILIFPQLFWIQNNKNFSLDIFFAAFVIHF